MDFCFVQSHTDTSYFFKFDKKKKKKKERERKKRSVRPGAPETATENINVVWKVKKSS